MANRAGKPPNLAIFDRAMRGDFSSCGRAGFMRVAVINRAGFATSCGLPFLIIWIYFFMIHDLQSKKVKKITRLIHSKTLVEQIWHKKLEILIFFEGSALKLNDEKSSFNFLNKFFASACKVKLQIFRKNENVYPKLTGLMRSGGLRRSHAGFLRSSCGFGCN